MANSDDLHKKKLEFLERKELELKNGVSSIEKKLLDIIVESVLDNLEVKDGTVLPSEKNIKLTQLLSDIFDDFNKNVNNNLLKQYVETIRTNTDLNKKYFGMFETDSKKLISVSDATKEIVNRRIGITDKGVVIKGGFLDSFIKDNRTQSRLQSILTQGITSGSALKDLRTDVKLFIVGDGKKLGSVQNAYSTLIYDTYQQVDRLEAGIYAQSLNMEAFIYSGGKVAQTRPFCCQRNGLIFTTEEASSWKNLEFQGKSNPYNPLIDLGGYGCRHSTQYISNVVAVNMRNDLELDKNGKLRYKLGYPKQSLNKCS